MSRVAITEIFVKGTTPPSFAIHKEVHVYKRGTEELVTIYSEEEEAEGGSPTLAQPLITDSTGRPKKEGHTPWVAPGSYDLKVGNQTIPFEATKGGEASSGDFPEVPASSTNVLAYDGSALVPGPLSGYYQYPTINGGPAAAPPSGNLYLFSEKNASGLPALFAEFPNGERVEIAKQKEAAPVVAVTKTFYPQTVNNAGGWENTTNLLNGVTSGFATVSAAATPAVIRLETFKILETIEEGATIEKVELVYKGKVAVAEGNPILGVQTKVGATFYPTSPVEDEGITITSTEHTHDITTAKTWARADFTDGGPFYLDLRARNNGGKTSAFSAQLFGVKITYKPPSEGKSPITHEDTMASSEFEATWGLYQAKEKGRYELKTTSGEAWPKSDGNAKANTNYRRLILKKGDEANVGNNRTELGANTSTGGIEGGSGTFMLYPTGVRRVTWFSMRLDPNFPLATINWQDVMQMKQTQPYVADAAGSVMWLMEARQNQFQIVTPGHSESKPLFTLPAIANRWFRFRFDMTYKKENGSFRLQVDNREGATSFVPQYDSGVFTLPTLTTASTAGSGYNVGDPIPCHLRLGLYHNPVIWTEKTAWPGEVTREETYVDIANVQVETPA